MGRKGRRWEGLGRGDGRVGDKGRGVNVEGGEGESKVVG